MLIVHFEHGVYPQFLTVCSQVYTVVTYGSTLGQSLSNLKIQAWNSAPTSYWMICLSSSQISFVIRVHKDFECILLNRRQLISSFDSWTYNSWIRFRQSSCTYGRFYLGATLKWEVSYLVSQKVPRSKDSFRMVFGWPQEKRVSWLQCPWYDRRISGLGEQLCAYEAITAWCGGQLRGKRFDWTNPFFTN